MYILESIAVIAFIFGMALLAKIWLDNRRIARTNAKNNESKSSKEQP